MIFFIFEVSRNTLRHATIGRTPLDEWSARGKDLYLTTHNNHNRQTPMQPAGFEPVILASEGPYSPRDHRDRLLHGVRSGKYPISEIQRFIFIARRLYVSIIRKKEGNLLASKWRLLMSVKWRSFRSLHALWTLWITGRGPSGYFSVEKRQWRLFVKELQYWIYRWLAEILCFLAGVASHWFPLPNR